MSQPLPPPPPGPSPDHERDLEPQPLRADHYDHDTAYARAMYPELQPKRPEQVKLPRWTVIFIFLLVIAVIMMLTSSTFKMLGK